MARNWYLAPQESPPPVRPIRTVLHPALQRASHVKGRDPGRTQTPQRLGHGLQPPGRIVQVDHVVQGLIQRRLRHPHAGPLAIPTIRVQDRCTRLPSGS